MNLFKWLFKTKKPPEPETPNIPLMDENGQIIDDPMLTETINRAFKTGKAVIANRNEDGTYEMRDIDF